MIRDKDKDKNIMSVMREGKAAVGEGASVQLDVTPDASMRVPVLPTGSPALDEALGVGGWPKERLVEVFGRKGAGKTTLALRSIAAVQAAGGVAAFIDVVHELDPGAARALGVDLGHLLVSQPDNVEQALGIVDTLAQSGAVDLIVLDEVSVLYARDALAGEDSTSFDGRLARLMSQAMRKLFVHAGRTGAVVLLLRDSSERQSAVNIAAQVAEENGGLDSYDGLCMELVDDVLHVQPGADFLWVDLEGHPHWTFHTAPVIDGVVHDAWNPATILPPADYVRVAFGRYVQAWEINPVATTI